MALDRKSLIEKFELRLILIANRTIPSLSLWRLIHNKDILLLLLLIYITSGTQNSNIFWEGKPKARG